MLEFLVGGNSSKTLAIASTCWLRSKLEFVLFSYRQHESWFGGAMEHYTDQEELTCTFVALFAMLIVSLIPFLIVKV